MFSHFPAPIALLTLLGVMGASAPAAAQDATDFEGARVDTGVGLDQLRFDLSRVGGTGRDKAGDAGYSVAVGYDKAVSPTTLIGIEGGFSFSDVDAIDNALHRRRELSIAGRIGTPITPNLLLYGKAGYTNLQVREIGEVSDLDGVLLGVGAEVKVSPTAYLKSEYRYSDYANGYVSNGIMTGLGIRF